MAFEEMKHHLSELDKRVTSYVDDSLQYIELKGFKISMVLVTSLVKFFLMASIGLLIILLLSIGVAIAIGESLGGYHWGFLIVGGFYVVIGLIVYAMRRSINKVILRFFSKKIFEET
ncbi:MAG: hypothetical protein ABF293_03400 [Flavobacteriaceae bacterium]